MDSILAIPGAATLLYAATTWTMPFAWPRWMVEAFSHVCPFIVNA